jgi:plasmid maintenance system antidote protein VapI
LARIDNKSRRQKNAKRKGHTVSPEHARLSILLQDAANQRGGKAALARELGISATGLGDLINSNRFVTMRIALRIEALLGVSARALLIEAATIRIDEDLAKARAGIPKKQAKAK